MLSDREFKVDYTSRRVATASIILACLAGVIAIVGFNASSSRHDTQFTNEGFFFNRDKAAKKPAQTEEKVTMKTFSMSTSMPQSPLQINEGCDTGFTFIVSLKECKEAFDILSPDMSKRREQHDLAKMQWAGQKQIENRPLGCFLNNPSGAVVFNTLDTRGKDMVGNDQVLCVEVITSLSGGDQNSVDENTVQRAVLGIGSLVNIAMNRAHDAPDHFVEFSKDTLDLFHMNAHGVIGIGASVLGGARDVGVGVLGHAWNGAGAVLGGARDVGGAVLGGAGAALGAGVGIVGGATRGSIHIAGKGVKAVSAGMMRGAEVLLE